MQNLVANQDLLLSKSEQVLLRLFNNSNTTTKKKSEKRIFKTIVKKETLPSKSRLSKKLDILELKSKNIKLYTTVKNIEKFVSEEYAIKYLNGYLEYNNLTLRYLINNI